MQFRQLVLMALALATAGAAPVRAQDSLAPLGSDSVLRSLVAEALARNPTVVQRQAAVRAATLRVRPAGTLPDPMLSAGGRTLQLRPSSSNRANFTRATAERA